MIWNLTRHFREQAEKHLLEEGRRRMAADYPGMSVPPPEESEDYFWSKVFVPLYYRLPWEVRKYLMRLTTPSRWNSP